jgi:hypothetical protein
VGSLGERSAATHTLSSGALGAKGNQHYRHRLVGRRGHWYHADELPLGRVLSRRGSGPMDRELSSGGRVTEEPFGAARLPSRGPGL